MFNYLTDLDGNEVLLIIDTNCTLMTSLLTSMSQPKETRILEFVQELANPRQIRGSPDSRCKGNTITSRSRAGSIEPRLIDGSRRKLNSPVWSGS